MATSRKRITEAQRYGERTWESGTLTKSIKVKFMSVRLIESLATTPRLAEVFSDASVLQAMLEFEAALARAQARLKVIPEKAARVIASAAQAQAFDAAKLAHATLRAGTPGIPLVKALTERVRARDSAAAGYVHWGATSQDIADTALVLLLKRARAILDFDLDRLQDALVRLAEKHKATVMLGRTLLQAAPPLTFGLKAAGWLGAVTRGRERLDASFDDALVIQLGGASGTTAAMGKQGLAVGQAMAKELELACPEAPWHTHRDRLASLICACAVLTGSLGKMARDISLLMQNEMDEVSEPGGEGRGGSSTMPHKNNPIACALALAQAERLPGLAASFLSAMVQEHERAAGGWQAEWPVTASAVQSTGLAIASMAEMAEGLKINSSRMRANLEATGGAVFAERAMMMLARKLGRDAAHKVLEEAVHRSMQQKRRLSEVLAEMPEAKDQLDAAGLRDLETPEHYLGLAEEFRCRLLASARSGRPARGGKKE